MKRLLILFVCSLVLTGTCFGAELGVARLSLVTGDVQVYTGEDDEWLPATRNMILKEGDRIWIPDKARAEVHILGGIYLRLDARSALDILTLAEDSYQFSLQRGHAYVNNRQGGIDYIQIETPVASIGCYDNSVVMVDVAESGVTDLSVLKGYSRTETPAGRTRVAAGNILRVTEALDTETFPLGKPDTWERWNHDRDERLARGTASLRYLPDELDDFAEELDDNGSWSLVEGYGYVWTPRVAITVTDWAPYRSGRWVWAGDQFVWVSYDPWGWAPHHYGRWVYLPARGWCWVPPPRNAVTWSPGYVGWTYTTSAVAWVPLAPGEAYYPQPRRGHEGGFRQPPVRGGYRNISVRNGVTVISRETFVTGRRGTVRVRGDELFRAAGATHAPPPFRPERSANAPVVRSIAAERRPPVRIREVTVNQIRQERRLQRDEKGSVFTPGRAVQPLPVKERTQPPRIVRPPQPAVAPQPARPEPRAERRRQPVQAAPSSQPARPVQRGAAPAAAPAGPQKGVTVTPPAASPTPAVRPQSPRESGARQAPLRNEERAPAAERGGARTEDSDRRR